MTSEKQASDAPNRRAAVISAWIRLQRLFQEDDRGHLLKPLEPMLQRYELGIFRLVVMGEIKKGKSSFINALLGEEKLLPTDSDVATSIVYKVMYGPQRKLKVFFLPDLDTGKRPEVLEIADSQLASYGTENGNPNNEKRVDFIAVELPHPLLRQGLVLVDTPGVGGLYKAHRRISRQYAPNADAVFFVLDSVERVISADEISFLQDLLSHITKRVFFIQTKIDLADMQQVEAWANRNKQVLMEKLGIPPNHLFYFLVSSKLKRIADQRHDRNRLRQSGFLEVLNFLQHGLMETKDRQLSADFARRLDKLCNDRICNIDEQLAIFQQQSRAQLTRLQQDYQEVRAQLQRWRVEIYPAVIQTFNRQFADLKRRKTREIQELLDPAGEMVEKLIEDLRRSEKSPNELISEGNHILQDWAAQAADRMGHFQQEFNQEFNELIDRTARALATFGIEPTTNLPLVQDDLEPVNPVHSEGIATPLGLFEQSRSALYGALAGLTMAKIGTGVGALVFPPLAAVSAAAAFVGLIMGGLWGRDEVVNRKREEVLAKLHSKLEKLARRCAVHYSKKFEEIADNYQHRAGELFKSAADEAQNTVQQRLDQIEQALMQTREQSQAKTEALQKKREELAAIQRQLRVVAAGTS